jgi:hypothetical protein
MRRCLELLNEGRIGREAIAGWYLPPHWRTLVSELSVSEIKSSLEGDIGGRLIGDTIQYMVNNRHRLAEERAVVELLAAFECFGVPNERRYNCDSQSPEKS